MHIRMISEGSCDTEDFAITRINDIWMFIKIEIVVLNHNISHYNCILVIKSFKNILKLLHVRVASCVTTKFLLCLRRWEGLKEGGLGGLKSEDKTGAAFRLLYPVNFAHRERIYTSTATMTAVLKMLCVLLCAVFASADVMPMTDFDLEKVKTQI